MHSLFGIWSYVVITVSVVGGLGIVYFIIGNEDNPNKFLIPMLIVVIAQAVTFYNLISINSKQIRLMYLFNPFIKNKSIKLEDIRSVTFYYTTAPYAGRLIRFFLFNNEVVEFHTRMLKAELKKLQKALLDKNIAVEVL